MGLMERRRHFRHQQRAVSSGLGRKPITCFHLNNSRGQWPFPEMSSGQSIHPWEAQDGEGRDRERSSDLMTNISTYLGGLLEDGGNKTCPPNWEGMLKPKKQGKQLHIIDESVYYKVTYSHGEIWLTALRKLSQLHSTPPSGHRNNVIFNLGFKGRCLKQDVQY